MSLETWQDTAKDCPVWRQTIHEGLEAFEETCAQQAEKKREKRKAQSQMDRPPSICVYSMRLGETVIFASGYQVIADDAPGTTTPERDQPVRNSSLPRLHLNGCLYEATPPPPPPDGFYGLAIVSAGLPYIHKCCLLAIFV